MNTVAILPKLCMKTLQRQNTKREIVKKVRFQKNEVATTKVVDEEKDKVKGLTTTTTMQYSNDCADAFESQNVLATATTSAAAAPVNRMGDEGTNEEANEEEDVKEPRDAITLSLVE